MVLESIMTPIDAEKHPSLVFFLGILYSSVAIFLSLWIFENYSSLVMVFLTVMASIPLFYNAIKLEELKDIELDDEKSIMREHSKALYFFMYFFFGVTLSFSIWYVFLPASITSNLFNVQTNTIAAINNQVTGNFLFEFNIFTKIFLNNVKVLVFCVLFSFVYGVGAIFILIWNASVIGVAIGNYIKTHISANAAAVGLMKMGVYFQAYSLGILRYSIHGIPEILAYFIGGLAGGIISIAIIRHDMGTKKFETIIVDSSDLLILAIIILVIAGLLEVFITPILF